MVDYGSVGDYLMVLITAIYVIATWKLVKENKKTNELTRLQINEARKYNEESLRPFVTVSLTISDGFVVLRFRNDGRRTAERVRVQFDYPISQRTMFGDAQKQILKREFNIVPEDALDLRLYVQTMGSYHNGEDEYKTIRLEYWDKERKYEDTVEINLASLNWVDKPKGVEKQLEKLAKEIGKTRRAL